MAENHPNQKRKCCRPKREERKEMATGKRTQNNVLLQAQKKRRESMENPMATVAKETSKPEESSRKTN